MLFHKKEKQPDSPVTYPYGFAHPTQPDTLCASRALTCALKGLFIFAATFGTVGGIVSSFELPCHLLTVMLLLFFFSMLLAFLHYNRILFNVCYPLVFLVFSYSIFTYRYQVNSGYQAFLSIMQEKYSDFFNLSILRESTEYISDRALSISFAAVFIGFFLIVLLNIAISEYMSLIAVFLLTFPLFQLGIFIGEMPAFPYLILLLFAYFMVGILKRSRHFLLPYRDKKLTEFAYKEMPKENRVSYRYHASGKVILQLTALFFVFSLLLGIICLPLLTMPVSRGRTSSLRQNVNDYMEIFVQSGLSGFFNRYEATGGISQGKLGGVSSVRPDYQTDLTITYVPFSYETLYLRAYTGATYTGSSWDEPSFDVSTFQKQFGDDYSRYDTFTAFLEAKRLQHYMNTTTDSGIYGKMEVENLDANSECLYLPYYTTDNISTRYTVNQGVIYGASPIGGKYELHYYPLLHDYWNIPENPDKLLESYQLSSPFYDYIMFYNMYNNTFYLDVPTHLVPVMEEVKAGIGEADTVNEQIALVQQYLADNYTYDMAPGATPYNEDYISYFLQTQKKGYCAHFASAATMLLRSYGIPARYTEGYAVSFLEVSEGEAVDEPYEEWFTGENPIGETGVVAVNVTDADAHAWVEVYKNGIGWVPYEFTPPSTTPSDGEDAYTDFWSMFSGIFRPSGTGTTGANTDTLSQAQLLDEWLQSSFLTAPLLLFVSGVLSFILLFFLIHRIRRWLKMYRAYQKGNYAPRLADRYKKICKKLKKRGYLEESFLLPSQFADVDALLSFTRERQAALALPLDAAMLLLEKSCFSKENITKKEADALLLFLKQYERCLRSLQCVRESK